ncbi:MAG: hypothetical protein HYZ23_06925 [Chloroflexi bacterium]|nr:hypothetical protein [Chloroflexota bacterium]
MSGIGAIIIHGDLHVWVRGAASPVANSHRRVASAGRFVGWVIIAIGTTFRGRRDDVTRVLDVAFERAIVIHRDLDIGIGGATGCMANGDGRVSLAVAITAASTAATVAIAAASTAAVAIAAPTAATVAIATPTAATVAITTAPTAAVVVAAFTIVVAAAGAPTQPIVRRGAG